MNERDGAMAQKMRTEAFLPALQRAVAEARQMDGSPEDLLNGAMMAFGDMLTTVTGKAGAVALLRGFADYVERGNPN